MPADRSVPVSVLIFTLDEEVHLPACLESVRWSNDIIVVDSYSTDATERIARAAGARFHQNCFEGFGKQRMWALENARPANEWVLILDADERVTPELAAEISGIPASCGEDAAAYRVKRRFHMWGRWLRYSSLYPTWVVRLIRLGRVEYVNRGHAETQQVDGQVRELDSDLIDENLKGIDEWFERQNRYSTKEAEFELQQEATPLDLRGVVSNDPLRRRAAMKRLAAAVPFRPWIYFLYSFVLRGGFREGRDGFVFCMMKGEYQRMIVAKKHDMRRAR